MEAKHTKGRLKAGLKNVHDQIPRIGITEEAGEQYVVADAFGDTDELLPAMEANASRLAASWNVFDGVAATELLEKFAALPASHRQQLVQVMEGMLVGVEAVERSGPVAQGA